MSLPNNYQTGKHLPNAVNNYCSTELGTSPGILSQDWLYTDLETPSIDQLPLYTPVNLADKPFDVFGAQAGGPLGGGATMAVPTTVSAADLNLNVTPMPAIGNATSQPSRTTSSSDDSLLLGSGGTDNSESLTTPEDSELAAKPTYKPGWATATDNTSSSAPQPRKRVKSNALPVKSQRTSPRNLSLSSARAVADTKEELGEESSPEMAAPGTSKSKRSHNLTEKKYRTRLNGYFETLLAAIPKQSGSADTPSVAGDAPEKKISKGEVLVLAMEYIKELERDQNDLEQQRKTLSSDMEHLKDASSGMEVGRRTY